MGRDSSVGKATRYGLDGPVSSAGDKIFRTHLDQPGAHPASYTMGTGSFPRAKLPGSGVDHPPPYRAEVKEKVPLLLLWFFMAC